MILCRHKKGGGSLPRLTKWDHFWSAVVTYTRMIFLLSSFVQVS